MLCAHERRAVAKGPASAFAVAAAGFEQLSGEVRLRQRGPADADERDTAIARIRGTGLEKIFLQIAVTAADHRQARISPLQLTRQPEMAVDADQWMLGCLIAIRRRVLEW